MIRRRLHASRVTTSATASSEIAGEDDSSESDYAEEYGDVHGNQDGISQNNDTDSNISEHPSSQEVLGEMERILCIPEPCPTKVPTQRSPLKPLDLVSLNASAVRIQEVDNYLASTSKGPQTPL